MNNDQLVYRSNAARYARRLPTLFAIVVVAEVVGSLSGKAVSQSGLADTASSALLGRAAYVLVAILVAAPLIARLFTGRLWAASEVVVTVTSVSLSLWLGPVLQFVASRIWSSGLYAAPSPGSITSDDLFWIVGIFVVSAGLEYFVWKSSSVSRVRRTYTGMWRAAQSRTAEDVTARAAVLRGLSGLARQETLETAPLVRAISRMYQGWLAPEALDQAASSSMVADVDSEMAALYGAPATDARELEH